MRCGQMKCRIVAHVCGVYSGASIEQHVGYFSSACKTSPMERTKAVVVALICVVLWVIEPDAHLQCLALAAPVENILHLVYVCACV